MSKKERAIQPAALGNQGAAAYLGVSPSTLEKSRVSGVLLGAAAPAYLRLGSKSIRYRRADLDAWLGQFQPFKHTADEQVASLDAARQQKQEGAR